MSITSKFPNPLKQVGFAAAVLIGKGAGHSWNVVRAFGAVMTERPENVGRVYTNRVADVAKIEKEQGVTLNKIPLQVEARELANMTTAEVIKAGLKHGFAQATQSKGKKGPAPNHARAAPGMKFNPI